MRILALDIDGFRGIQKARLRFPEHGVLIGPNGIGKSTVVDALSLVFGRTKLVKELTEHDFYGSNPDPGSRVRIVATLGGFDSNRSEDHPTWFRHGRGVPRWWSAETQEILSESSDSDELCVQIGYAARFDAEEMAVEQIRYFHDGPCEDPFLEDAVARFPQVLLKEIGYFVLPARRTWASSLSFASELFRQAVGAVGTLPADSVRRQLQELRAPQVPMEDDPGIKELVERLERRLGQMLAWQPRFQLRLTSTDSESLLNALVPHYKAEGDEVALPAVRHGTGLISLQTFALLLEIGHGRATAGLSFILALEEPELHIPPGLQRRLLGEAISVSDQTICTTHAPRLAALYEAREISILFQHQERVKSKRDQGEEVLRCLEAKPLAPRSMMQYPNPLGKLFTEHRSSLVEALLLPVVLVPEGRTDHGWISRLLDTTETCDRAHRGDWYGRPHFGSIVGVIPTRDSHLVATCGRLQELTERVAALVDGDEAGDKYIGELLGSAKPPMVCLQWPKGWRIEDVVVWILEVGGAPLLKEINDRLARDFESFEGLRSELLNEDGRTGGLKQFDVAHEEIASAMKGERECIKRASTILDAIAAAVTGRFSTVSQVVLDPKRSLPGCSVLRFHL